MTPRYANKFQRNDKYVSMLVLKHPHALETAHVQSDLRIRRLDTSQLRGLVICQFVHGALGKVEAVGGVVDCEDVDGFAVVGYAVACAALYPSHHISQLSK